MIALLVSMKSSLFKDFAMPKRPADMNQLGKHIVDIAVGDAIDKEPTNRQIGGMASAAKLTKEQRKERAVKAAKARWRSKD